VTTTAPLRPPRRPHGRLALALVASLVLAFGAGCSDAPEHGKSAKSGTFGKDGKSRSITKTAETPSIRVKLTPADKSAGVAPATPVVVGLDEGKLASVKLVSAGGDVVAGTLAPGGTSWTSNGKLSFGTHYTVQVTTDRASTPQTVGGFETVPKPARSVRVSSQLGDGKTYGIGMPVILKLDGAVKSPAARAALEKSLTVTSTPPTAGAWGWVNSRELHFRPKTYWAAGSKVHVKVDTAGRDLGNGLWGRTDITVDFKIGVQRTMKVDSATHSMQVIEGGRVIRTMPVSLGKPATPSSAGTLLVIDKRPEALFDSSTYGLPVDAKGGYRTKVQFAMRLTWGGEFFHAAPWSIPQQGHTNVSHGCVNLAPANAAWLFNRVTVGDPVTVLHTERAVKPGDGYTDWSVDFAGWLKQSATGEHATA
jgi:lipoprotein-anchoring transpeptidase ErfK/SrfK